MKLLQTLFNNCALRKARLPSCVQPLSLSSPTQLREHEAPQFLCHWPTWRAVVSAARTRLLCEHDSYHVRTVTTGVCCSTLRNISCIWLLPWGPASLAVVVVVALASFCSYCAGRAVSARRPHKPRPWQHSTYLELDARDVLLVRIFHRRHLLLKLEDGVGRACLWCANRLR
jgi:hypothetical protein